MGATATSTPPPAAARNMSLLAQLDGAALSGGGDQVERGVFAPLGAHGEALGDAVDQLPGAGGGIDAALVADEVADEGVVLDLDTHEDYERIRQRFA